MPQPNPHSKLLAMPAVVPTPVARQTAARRCATGILFGLSFGHLLNDSIQALLPAIYPVLKDSFRLSFTQIGLITLTFQLVGSVLQPVVGWYTDRRPQPFSLVYGMAVTLFGTILLALAPNYGAVLVAAGLIGLGSAVFHPESSRMARLASGGRYGLAQSLFQVGGNLGSALGPLLASWIIAPLGQRHILWFTTLAMGGMWLAARMGRWYRDGLSAAGPRPKGGEPSSPQLPRRLLGRSMTVLLVLMFSKFFYLASMTSYYTFYLMHRFQVSVPMSQFYLFVFLGAGVLGTLAGGWVGDRFGRRQVIWLSILGVAPFTLVMPYVGLGGTAVLSVCIAAVMASAFPAILVYAIELLPGRVGLLSGLFFGLAFGLAGIGSAVLGKLADVTSIEFVFKACAYLPLLGLFTWFLPATPKE